MRAFLSIVVVLVFIPFVYSELDMQNRIMDNVNEIKYNKIERIMFDEFRYSTEDAFLVLVSEDFTNNEMEEFTCTKLLDWASKKDFDMSINYFYENEGPIHLGNNMIFSECMLFLSYGKDKARLAAKCPDSFGINLCPEMIRPYANSFFELGGKILETSGVNLGFVAEKEIQNHKVKAIIRGSDLVESTDIS